MTHIRTSADFIPLISQSKLEAIVTDEEAILWWAYSWIARAAYQHEWISSRHNVYLRFQDRISTCNMPYFSLASGSIILYQYTPYINHLIQTLHGHFVISLGCYYTRSIDLSLSHPLISGISLTEEQIIHSQPFNLLIEHAHLHQITCYPEIATSRLIRGGWKCTSAISSLVAELNVLAQSKTVCCRQVHINIPLPVDVIPLIRKVFPRVASLIVITPRDKPIISGIIIYRWHPQLSRLD